MSKKQKRLLKELEKDKNEKKKGVVIDLSFWEKVKENEKKPKITVAAGYNVINGLSGLKRDAFLRLCGVLCLKSEQIRIIIGMCGEYFEWKNHKVFSFFRPRSFVPSLRYEDGQECKLSSSGKWCVLFGTVIFGHPISKGVFRLTVEIRYSRSAHQTEIRLGAIPGGFVFPPAKTDPQLDLMVDDDGVPTMKHFPHVPGGCFFHFGQMDRFFDQGPYEKYSYDDRFILSGAIAADYARYGPPKPHIVSDGSVVSLEIDADKRRMFLFIGDEKMKYVFTQIAVPACLAISGLNEECMAVRSFVQLPAADSLPCPCLFFRCQPQ